MPMPTECDDERRPPPPPQPSGAGLLPTATQEKVEASSSSSPGSPRGRGSQPTFERPRGEQHILSIDSTGMSPTSTRDEPHTFTRQSGEQMSSTSASEEASADEEMQVVSADEDEIQASGKRRRSFTGGKRKRRRVALDKAKMQKGQWKERIAKMEKEQKELITALLDAIWRIGRVEEEHGKQGNLRIVLLAFLISRIERVEEKHREERRALLESISRMKHVSKEQWKWRIEHMDMEQRQQRIMLLELIQMVDMREEEQGKEGKALTESILKHLVDVVTAQWALRIKNKGHQEEAEALVHQEEAEALVHQEAEALVHQEEAEAAIVSPSASHLALKMKNEDDQEAEAVTAVLSNSSSQEKGKTVVEEAICKPCIPHQVIGDCTSKEEIHEQLPNVCLAKDWQIKFPDRRLKSEGLDYREFLLVRPHATKIILKAAKFVVCLSSYIGNKLLRQCSGFLIEWDEDSKDAMVLTSAHLICCETSLNEWTGEHKYAPNVEVYVQLVNDDRIKGELMYYHKHYGFALIRVTLGRPAELARFGEEVNCAQSVYVLGRDENLNMQLSNGIVQYRGPSVYEHHHYMYMDAVVLECTLGGPVIDENGDVMGMASLTANMGFIPCSVLLKCLHLWKAHKCVPRIQLGMKFAPIMFQDLIYIEKLSSLCNFEMGLIVIEMAGGSIAEQLDVRYGDIILSVNGKCIANTVELELALLRICEDNLVRGNGIGSYLDLTVDVFYTNKQRNPNPVRIELTAIMSDEDVEVIKEGSTLTDTETSDSGGSPSDTGTSGEVSDG
ncbi:unnamed protein product [Urochloa humidicola]